MTKVNDIVAAIHEVAPFDYQESYDNSGLLCGNPEMEVSGVLVALDCIESIVDELGIDAIVARHAGEFDREQLEHDVRKQLLWTLRELV